MYSNDMQEDDPWLPVRTVMEVGSRPPDGEERRVTCASVWMRWSLREVLRVWYTLCARISAAERNIHIYTYISS
jgi:hypothetical protein